MIFPFPKGYVSFLEVYSTEMTGDRFWGFVKCVVVSVCCKTKWHKFTVTSAIQQTKNKLTSAGVYDLSKTTRFYKYLHAVVISFQLHVPPGYKFGSETRFLVTNGKERPATSTNFQSVMVKVREMYHDVMAHPFRNVSEWWGSFWGRDLVYKGLMTWYVKKTQMFLSEWSTFPEKKGFPPTWGREYHSLQKTQILKPALETSSYHILHFAIGISSHSCLMKTQRTT